MASMINTIVNSADSLEEFKGSIAQLAKRHVHMGVKREYFPIVVKAIISSVEDQYGKGFTSAHKKAWYKILNQVSAIMIEEMDAYQRSSRHTAA
jgi:hemoglobin-like flavoprotein